MQVNIRSNVDAITRDMERRYKSQIPYATSMAVNEVAGKAKKEVEKQLKSLDNPTSYTVKAAFISLSSKRQSPIQAIVGVKDRQAGYLVYAEEGGTSKATGKAKPVPTGASKNKFGNLARGTTKKIGQKSKGHMSVFSGTPNGGGRSGGIYQRIGSGKSNGHGKLKMLASWHTATHHHKRIRIGERVALSVRRNMDKSLSKQIALAINTAR